jgi:hypothetical protein
MAIGYASFAMGTGMELIKRGTRMPPPVHARIMDTSLYETETFGLAANTLLPDHRVKDGG